MIDTVFPLSYYGRKMCVCVCGAGRGGARGGGGGGGGGQGCGRAVMKNTGYRYSGWERGRGGGGIWFRAIKVCGSYDRKCFKNSIFQSTINGVFLIYVIYGARQNSLADAM